MENISGKISFLKEGYVPALQSIDPAATPLWGKMNAQQMVEHMSDYFRIANGKTPMELITEADRLPRMQGFLTSEKPFPENTPNVLLPDEPPAVRHEAFKHAIDELKAEIACFFDTFKPDPTKTIVNPFFGHLDFEHQVQLLYKHATHHLRQFGVNASL